MTIPFIHVFYGIITVTTQQMSAAIFRRNARRSEAFEYFIPLVIKAEGEDNIHFLKLCGCCCVVARREAPGLALATGALLRLTACLCCRVQLPQRSVVQAAREASECAGSGPC